MCMLRTVREEVTRQLYVYIEALPSEQKKVILMSIEGYSWDEIAEKLGISEIRSRLIKVVDSGRYVRSFRIPCAYF